MCDHRQPPKVQRPCSSGENRHVTLDQAPEIQPTKRRRINLETVLISLGILVGVMFVIFGLNSATTALTDIQLTINRGDDQFSIVAAGGVATQSPAAGDSLARGTAVTVAVSKGPDLVAVPQLLNLKFDKVGSAVVNSGFVVGAISGDTRGFPIAIYVAGQPVAVGQLLPRGTTLDLVYYGS